MKDDLKRLVEEAEVRANAATPGPWWKSGECVRASAPNIKAPALLDIADSMLDDNAHFIAYAREDVPALCAAVRELDAENSNARAIALRMIHSVAPEVAARNETAPLFDLLDLVSAALFGALTRKP